MTVPVGLRSKARSSVVYIDQFEHRVAGIPCQIGVTHFFRQAPWKGSAHTAPSDMDYYGYTEMEYDILDRRGRPAAWLESKMTDADHDSVKEAILRRTTDD